MDYLSLRSHLPLLIFLADKGHAYLTINKGGTISPFIDQCLDQCLGLAWHA